MAAVATAGLPDGAENERRQITVSGGPVDLR
jgi:hypothetical protein